MMSWTEYLIKITLGQINSSMMKMSMPVILIITPSWEKNGV